MGQYLNRPDNMQGVFLLLRDKQDTAGADKVTYTQPELIVICVQLNDAATPSLENGMGFQVGEDLPVGICGQNDAAVVFDPSDTVGAII